MRLLKIFFSILLLMVAVLAIALFALWLLVDPNKLKPVLEVEVLHKTGYRLTIAGKLQWSFLPQIGIEAQQVTISDNKTNQPLALLIHPVITGELAQLWRHRDSWSGHLSAKQLQYKNVWFDNVKAKFFWQNRMLLVDQITAGLYTGNLMGNFQINNALPIPKWRWHLWSHQVQIQPLLSTINHTTFLAGSGQIDFIGETSGRNPQERLSHLTGQLQFAVTDGTIKGINLNFLVQMADALINKQPLPVMADLKVTAFTQLTGSAKIENNIIWLKDLYLTAPAFTTTGSGLIELPTDEINFQLKLQPVRSFSAKQNWLVPVLIRGTLAKPILHYDMDQLKQQAIKDKINDLKEKAKQQIQLHVSGEASQFLNRLLGR